MSIVKDRVGEVFDESLPRLLEFLEGGVGQHQQWSFIRKVTLKQVNDLRRRIELILEQDRDSKRSSSNGLTGEAWNGAVSCKHNHP